MADTGGWTNRHLRGQIYLSLQGAALQYAENCPQEKIATAEALCDTLRHRFEGEVARLKARDALRGLRRNRKETAEELGARALQLARRGYDPAQAEEEGKTAFCMAIEDQALRDQLSLSGFQTVEECMNAVAKVECDRERANRQRQAVRLCQVEARPATHSEDNQQVTTESKRKSAPVPVKQVAISSQKVAAPSGGDDAEKRELKKTITELHQQLEAARAQTGLQKGGPPADGKVRARPSPDYPCHLCRSPNHWMNQCPSRGQILGNGQGLTQRSTGQSQDVRRH